MQSVLQGYSCTVSIPGLESWLPAPQGHPTVIGTDLGTEHFEDLRTPTYRISGHTDLHMVCEKISILCSASGCSGLTPEAVSTNVSLEVSLASWNNASGTSTRKPQVSLLSLGVQYWLPAGICDSQSGT